MVDRVPLFVRLPADQARRLDDHVRAAGRSKQEVVGALLATSMARAGDDTVGPARTEDAGPVPAGLVPLVLTVDEVAAELRVAAADVEARIEQGDLPARRFGEQWRIGRQALIDWLGESDIRRPAGFRPHRD